MKKICKSNEQKFLIAKRKIFLPYEKVYIKHHWVDRNNPISYNISEYIKFFQYTKKQKEIFNSENFQRKFLIKYPERHLDLTIHNLEIHPKIKKEFVYIFEGEDMGFFN